MTTHARPRLPCLRFLACFFVAACNNSPPAGGQPDQAMSLPDQSVPPDLSSPVLADLTQLAPVDLAITDLEGYSDVGGPCGGFTVNPRRCLPGLVCVPSAIPDVPGTCASPDAGACIPNGGNCDSNAQCCSGNCILRGNPGFCCQPGGCP
jgi:hypothetical protein